MDAHGVLRAPRPRDAYEAAFIRVLQRSLVFCIQEAAVSPRPIEEAGGHGPRGVSFANGAKDIGAVDFSSCASPFGH